MTSNDSAFSRRVFAKGLALAPIGLMATSVFGQAAGAGQESKPADAPPQSAPTPEKKKPKTAAEYNRHPEIHETDPFAEPLTFARADVRPLVLPFALDEVLLEPGPLQQARDWNRSYMLRLGNDRLLHNFRVNAGLPSSAEPLGGWEAPKSELRGHFVGHYLSAAAMLYAATGDTAIKAKADELVAGIAECQAKLNDGGYVSAFPVELFARLDQRTRVWAPFYTLHKIMAGLLDMKIFAGNQQALDVLVTLAGWVDGWTKTKTEEHMQDILNTEYGGMNDVLYNLAVETGDDRWARVGDRFTKKVFFTPLATRRDELKGLHANTHMPQVIGAARRYEISSDYRFADVSNFFFETVSEARTYATGGSGNTEGWLTQPGHLGLEMRVSSHHQECCCAYNMMKLSRHLFSWSGDTRFIEYYERNLLNHRLGMIQPETGLTSYFLSMSPAAWKTTCTEDETFWCCTGTALEEFAKLNDSIYFHDDDSLFVNLYASSVVYWKECGVRLRQQTNFPETDRTVLTVESSSAKPWTMRLRIPSWTTIENVVTINGRPIGVAGTPGSYLTLTRRWKAGDRVDFTMPMRVTVEHLADDPTQQAFLYGPLVLAGQFPKKDIDSDLEHNQAPEIQEAPAIEVPALGAKGKEPGEWIHTVPGQPLTFRTTGQAQDVTLRPINQSWERFAVYWTVS
jgi:uncharacterized protein